MIHIMHLDDKYFIDTKLGLKRIEFRLNDLKRKNIKVGDIINFINRSNENLSIKAKIINILYDTNFDNLVINLNRDSINYDFTELINSLKEIYSKEDINLFGVLAIEFDLL